MDTAQNQTKERFQKSLRFALILLSIIWIVHLSQYLLGIRLGFLGIYPRHLFGLKGIVFAPFIHSDWGHLFSNSAPLFFLSGVIMYFYRTVALKSIIMMTLLTGLAVWLFAAKPYVYHIGASGVVYGMVAFVFWNGIFRRSIQSIVLALIVAFYYGGMFLGIVPGEEGVSWESHLFGGLVGIFASFYYKAELEEDEKPPKYSWDLEQEAESTFFLPRDVFEKTRAEREQEENNPDNWISDSTV